VSGERATYLDSSAIVKLAVREPETAALRRWLRGKRSLVTSALARTEVARALLPHGADAVGRGADVLSRLEVVRLSDRILTTAGALFPTYLRTLDAIHVATALELGSDLARMCTYDARLAAVAAERGWSVVAPA
jgi:uncharacterized protein